MSVDKLLTSGETTVISSEYWAIQIYCVGTVENENLLIGVEKCLELGFVGISNLGI